MPASRLFFSFLALVAWPAWALEPDELYSKVSPSIVVVLGYDSADPSEAGLGSGVIISPGVIVTNCHVIKGRDAVFLKRGEFVSRAEVQIRDPERDLCQVSAVEKEGFEQAIPGVVPVAELRVGQKVYALGAPEGLELTLSDGLISSLRHLKMGTIIQTNAPISHGSSGGGLFDTEGRLVGITTFGFVEGQNLNFALPADWVSELQSRHAIRQAMAKEAAERARLAAEKERRQEAMQLAEEIRQEEEAERQEQFRREEEARRREEEATQQLEERRRTAAAVEEQWSQDEAAHKQREAGEARRKAEADARAARDREVADYVARIRAKIQGRVVIPPNLRGNPQVVYEVTLLPGGDVLQAVLKRGSGAPAYDAAVERAIMAAQPLPVPSDPRLFRNSFRILELKFRPKE